MAKTTKSLTVLTAAIVAAGCGGHARPVKRPFVALGQIIDRVAVQLRLAPSRQGDLVRPGLRSWNGRDSSPVDIPAGRYAWVQSNFLMRNCELLPRTKAVTVNRSTTLTYSARGADGTQVVVARGARIILTRGPRHPRLPINRVG